MSARVFCTAAIALLLASPASAQEPEPDPCENLLAASVDRRAWPGLVAGVPSGDTLLVRMKGAGLRRVRLAGIQAPHSAEPLGAVARYHLSRLALGQRVFVVHDLSPKAWPEPLVAQVEHFAEAQLGAGMARFRPDEEDLLGAYLACKCRSAAAQAEEARLGLWR